MILKCTFYNSIFSFLLLWIGFSQCKKEVAVINNNKLDKTVVHSGFLPLWQLYKTSSRGGWKNNDDGRFSNDDAPAMDALLILFQLTDDTRYLDTFFVLANHILASDDIGRQAVDVHRKRGVLPGWSSTRYTHDKTRTIFMLDDALILLPMLRAYNLLNQEQKYNQYNVSKFLQRAVLEFDKVFVPDWISKSNTEGYFQDIYYTNRDINMPFNQFAVIGVLCLELYQATKDDKYLKYATQMATFLKNNLTAKDESYVWYYKLPSNTYPSKEYDDFSHAQSVVEFIIYAHKAGIVFTENDIRLITNTFLKQITTPDNKVYKHFGGFINETTPLPNDSKYADNPWLEYYYLLVPYSAAIKDRMLYHHNTRRILFDSNSDFNHIGQFVLLHYALHLKYMSF